MGYLPASNVAFPWDIYVSRILQVQPPLTGRLVVLSSKRARPPLPQYAANIVASTNILQISLYW
jgi:hypothetical protein